MSTATEERFWAKVERTPTCWLWRAAKNKQGYGVFSRGSRAEGLVLAHRMSWELTYGNGPTGVLRHTCDTPACCRPDHLIDGMQAENVQDAIERGRACPPPHLVGSEVATAVLHEDDVREIRRLVEGGERHIDVARRYGVTRSNISRIIARKSWAHV